MMKDFLYSVASGRRRDWIARIAHAVLLVVSWIYGAGVGLMLAAYESGLFRRKHLSVPVISVGNLTFGGVGKTPMVIYIVRMLKAKGIKPIVLTRGYMPRGQKDFVSDEAEILRNVLDGVPVIVNPDRYKGGLEAIAQYQPDVIVLDDGFQHWRLFRNLDIVLIDAINPFGNENLLPAGILREPLSSLKRADLLVLTKTDQGEVSALRDRCKAVNSRAPVIETIHRPTGLVNVYTNNFVQLAKLSQPVVAFCGIGNPASFEATLGSLHTGCKQFVAYADHHVYGLDDMAALKKICDQQQTNVLVTTQKDAVKLLRFKEFWQGYELYSLNIDIIITQGQHEFMDRIHHLLHG